jgi:hypothetical protein
MVMLVVLLVVVAVTVLGAAAVSLAVGDIRVSGNYRDSALAFWAADGALQQGVEAVRQNPAFTGAVTLTPLSNATTTSASVVALSTNMVQVLATGKKGPATKTLEAVLNTDSVFTGTINVGGDLTLAGKPRISGPGVRVNGNAALNLDPGTPNFNLMIPTSSTVSLTGNNAYTRVNTPAMDLGAVAPTTQEWMTLANQAAPAWYFGSGAFGSQQASQTFVNLDFGTVTPGPTGQRTIFVDGNVPLNGSLSGTGTIITTGSITADNGFVTNGSTVSMVAQGNILLNFDTNAQSSMNGLIFSEGNYELHGKISFTGIVTAFGSVDVQAPSQFTNNSDPNFWYTYSSAYNILSDPAHVLSWAQDT